MMSGGIGGTKKRWCVLGKVRCVPRIQAGAYRFCDAADFHIASESIHENYREVQFAGSFEQSRANAMEIPGIENF